MILAGKQRAREENTSGGGYIELERERKDERGWLRVDRVCVRARARTDCVVASVSVVGQRRDGIMTEGQKKYGTGEKDMYRRERKKIK